MDKSALRVEMQLKRQSLSAGDYAGLSAIIQRKLFQTKQWQQAREVACYVSIPNEVDTQQVLKQAWDSDKKVYVPKVNKGERTMQFLEIDALDKLEAGAYQIPEPFADHRQNSVILQPGVHTLFLVPGLVFDKWGYRIGYGGGYYDRFMKENCHTHMTTVALAYNFQLVMSPLPAETHDQAVDVIQTEQNNVDCKQNRNTCH